jgi:hypothetical protein
MWLLEVHTPIQVDHSHPQLATQYQEPSNRHASQLKASCFPILPMPGDFHSYLAWRTSVPYHPGPWKSHYCRSKSRNPSLPLSGNPLLCKC